MIRGSCLCGAVRFEVVRFIGPFAVICYFVFFVTIEMIASNYFLPKDAFGTAFSWLCLGLTAPVLIAAFVVRRLENRQDEIPDR